MSEEKKVNPLLRAWAAGVFDARISFPKAGCVLRMDTVDGELVRRFHDVVGVGKVMIDKSKEASGRTNLPVSVFTTTSLEDTRKLLIFVSPLLSPLKMRQASELIAKIERNPYWLRKNKEGGILSGTARVPSAAGESVPESTQTDGGIASPAE